MQTKFTNSNNFINSVSLGKDWLMKFCGRGIKYDYAYYTVYNVVDYGFDYLILNLKEHLGLADDTAYQRDGFSGGKDSVQSNKIILERTYDETRCNTN